ncbi:hypothetical protein PIB30_017644 [Stylosanthes scabra]|uniref:RRM domain-containing protein n=1 Tax=Stylosanthes scabra TaxID=79078 RepID=A0ABU6X9I6_9FABA|nr:hypothetical protein [Stylosanthes scabra]
MSGRVGVSGRVWRRVAHSDVTGYTSRRNKGENVGRFAYGDMEDGNRGITKTWSDIVQGKGKAIGDSRRCVYDSKGGSVRAIESLQGAIIKGRRIVVNETKFKREQNDEHGLRKHGR